MTERLAIAKITMTGKGGYLEICSIVKTLEQSHRCETS